MYAGATAFGLFLAGEQVAVTASTPTSSFGNPTTMTLRVRGLVVGTTAFPGTLSYRFPADTTTATSVSWSINSSNVTWTVSCALARPTSADQCKNGGWEAFGSRNQGDCVSFVTTEGRNELDQNVPNT